MNFNLNTVKVNFVFLGDHFVWNPELLLCLANLDLWLQPPEDILLFREILSKPSVDSALVLNRVGELDSLH